MVEINFSKMSDDELLASLGRINKNLFPENYDAALAEIYRRQLPLPTKTDLSVVKPWRRFWAKVFDHFSYAFIIALFGLQFEKEFNISMEPNLFLILVTLTFPVYESLLLATWGNTIGKGLLGVNVVNQSGLRPSFKQALNRNYQCLIWGNGLSIPIISLIANILAYKNLTRIGKTSWDTSAGTKIVFKELT